MILHYQPYTKQTERNELQWNYPWFHKEKNKNKTKLNTYYEYITYAFKYERKKVMWWEKEKVTEKKFLCLLRGSHIEQDGIDA